MTGSKNGTESQTTVSELNPRKLPCWIESFIEYTNEAPSPEIFRRWSGISAVAGALERRCWVQTTASKLYPNLFILLVAPPGVGKDQAIVPMKELIASTGLFNLAPISMTHKGLIDHLASEACHKQYVDNGVWESYHSILVAVPELGVLVPGHDLAFLSSLNELYNCWDVYEERTRMKGETLKIDKPHIHILSGTQPKYLGELFPEAAYGMGFTSRIIMIYSGDPIRVRLFGNRQAKLELGEELKIDLKSIAKLRGPFNLEEDAQSLVEKWHAYGSEQDKPTHTKLMHYNSRRIMHVLKIAMAFSASRSNDLIITVEDFKRSLDTLLEAEMYMPEIFKEISSGGQAGELEECFHFLIRIYNKTKKPIPEYRLVHFLTTRVPTNQIQFMIDTMLRSKMIEETGKVSGLNLPGSERLFKPLALKVTE